MKSTYTLCTKAVRSLIMRTRRLTSGIALILLCFCMGCSLNTVGNFGNTLIEAAIDINIFTDAEELQIGKEYVAQHERKVKIYTDPVVTNYINDLGQSLVIGFAIRHHITC